ncbi:hypothetical protein [Kitasatospora sp. LaBMicrA B282]|uniref:hypothetical protein n=1 Tax=Kitasatospora sp. LaBMicrA B282 TaxID=3420949 RepID=UPI003D142E3B
MAATAACRRQTKQKPAHVASAIGQHLVVPREAVTGSSTVSVAYLGVAAGTGPQQVTAALGDPAGARATAGGAWVEAHNAQTTRKGWIAAALGLIVTLLTQYATVLLIENRILNASQHAAYQVPWSTLAGSAGLCLVLALVASLVPARLALRIRPLDLVAGRQ